MKKAKRPRMPNLRRLAEEKGWKPGTLLKAEFAFPGEVELRITALAESAIVVRRPGCMEFLLTGAEDIFALSGPGFDWPAAEVKP